jgi:hypothetical protein
MLIRCSARDESFWPQLSVAVFVATASLFWAAGRPQRESGHARGHMRAMWQSWHRSSRL